MLALEALSAELASGDDARAGKAASRFVEYGYAGFDALISLQKSEDADIRWWAIRALAEFEDSPELTAVLIRGLQDGDAMVRQSAALALMHHPCATAIEPLALALADEDSLTASLAANALIGLAGLATGRLLQVLGDGAPRARVEAARALASIKDPQSITGLMKALETESALLKYWAGIALENMGVGMVYFHAR